MIEVSLLLLLIGVGLILVSHFAIRESCDEVSEEELNKCEEELDNTFATVLMIVGVLLLLGALVMVGYNMMKPKGEYRIPEQLTAMFFK